MAISGLPDSLNRSCMYPENKYPFTRNLMGDFYFQRQSAAVSAVHADRDPPIQMKGAPMKGRLQ
jgi:hypothetical protein